MWGNNRDSNSQQLVHGMVQVKGKGGHVTAACTVLSGDLDYRDWAPGWLLMKP